MLNQDFNTGIETECPFGTKSLGEDKYLEKYLVQIHIKTNIPFDLEEYKAGDEEC